MRFLQGGAENADFVLCRADHERGKGKPTHLELLPEAQGIFLLLLLPLLLLLL
jgi:hypothetical protein